MKQKQKKAAKAVLGCLVLLLLYGCASRGSYLYGGEARGEDSTAEDAADGDFSWVQGQSEDAADGSEDPAGAASGAMDGAALTDSGGGQSPGGSQAKAADGAAPDGNGRPTSDGSSPGAAGGTAPGSGASGVDAASGTIAVYVCGAVKKPGVYELAAGSRVYEAVAMAGGMTKDAAERSVNQAETLSDGQMIVILTEEEALNGEYPDGAAPGGEVSDGGAANPGDGRVNINTAGEEELKTLPGIGDAKAAAIVAYRQEHGAFSAVSDIKRVSGIGESVFEGLEDLIRVD